MVLSQKLSHAAFTVNVWWGGSLLLLPILFGIGCWFSTVIGKHLGRQEWVDKNQEYLDLLIKMEERIHQEGIVHKNGALREDPHA